MLERIAKRDKDWRRIALKVCKNKNDADDLVQDMYLKLHSISEKYPDKHIKDSYAMYTLYSLFTDKCRKATVLQKKECKIEDAKTKVNNTITQLSNDSISYELDDEELKLINKIKELDKAFYQIYLEMNYSQSIRSIAKELGTDYGFIYRRLKKARKFILEDEYDTKYKNKRNKRK